MNIVNYKNKQSGAAAMITVVFVAIILSIMTLSFIRLALNESRISTDDDLTTRAYYAAESGVEEAKRAIKEVQEGTLAEADLNGEECDLPTSFDGELSTPTDYDMGYICQFIDLTPAVYQHHFTSLYQTVQVPLNAVDNDNNPATFTRMEISWHVNNATASGGDGAVGTDAVARTPNNDVRFPKVADWNSSNYPAMLRANLISHPSGAISRAGIDNFIAYLNPVAGSGNLSVPSGNSAETYQADCDSGVSVDEKFCKIEFTNFDASRDYTLRLTNLYDTTHVEVRLYDGATPVLFSDVQAIVDVTGRAGSVYRRVESVVNLNTRNILLNDAITSLKDICKDFIFTNNESDFNGVAGTSCTN